MNKSIWSIPIYIVILVVACEFIYWSTCDFILFNTEALNYNLEFLYYTSAGFLSFGLTILLIFLWERIKPLFRYLLFVLVNAYAAACLFHVYTKACDYQRNLNSFYTGLVILLLLLTFWLLITKVLPRMKPVDFIIVGSSTILFLIDAIFLLIGYRIFYPGYW